MRKLLLGSAIIIFPLSLAIAQVSNDYEAKAWLAQPNLI